MRLDHAPLSPEWEYTLGLNDEGLVTMYKSASNETIRSFRTHSRGEPKHLAFSPSESWRDIAILTGRWCLHVFDTQSWRQERATEILPDMYTACYTITWINGDSVILLRIEPRDIDIYGPPSEFRISRQTGRLIDKRIIEKSPMIQILDWNPTDPVQHGFAQVSTFKDDYSWDADVVYIITDPKEFFRAEKSRADMDSDKIVFLYYCQPSCLDICLERIKWIQTQAQKDPSQVFLYRYLGSPNSSW